MKILLLGKNGQVGQELQRTLLPLGEVTALGREDINLEDTPNIESVLNAHTPGLIVNAAAYTAVDKAESDCERAFRVNAKAVEVMARFAGQRGATLVHYSTDYVFDGHKDAPYLEADPTDPQSVYGRSKRAGEIAITESGCHFLLFRTSWVFSATGVNFIRTILRLAAERPSLRVVTDQFGAPTSAELIADVTGLAIAAHRRGNLADGIYHLTAAGRTSWHALARYVVEQAISSGLAMKLGADDIEPISTAEYPLPAPRPRNSSLNTQALASGAGVSFPAWTVHVDRALAQIARQELTR